MPDRPLLACVIAIERDPDARVARRVLAPGDAGQLAAHVMTDLAARLPQVERCGLALAGALYDATELLQPGWPLFHELVLHYRRSGGGDTPRLLGLGASNGRMPTARLDPDPERAGALLSFLPFVLLAPDDVAPALAAGLEEVLVASGQVGAAGALAIDSLFGLRPKHAQYMTRLDLCALMAAQLDPLGLAPLWSLLETALLAPHATVDVEDGSAVRWCWEHGAVRSGFRGYRHWRASPAGRDAAAAGRIRAAFADVLLMQRQYRSILGAHAVPVRWPGELPRISHHPPAADADPSAVADGGEKCGLEDALLEILAEGEADQVRALRLPGLGLAALFACRGERSVAIGYPFSTAGHAALARRFAALPTGPDLPAWPEDIEAACSRP